MKRRSFIHLASAAGISTFAFSPIGCKSDTGNNASETDSDLKEISITEIQRKMKDGSLTSRRLTQFYLDQIETLDKNGPKLHAVIELNPEALSIAESLDKERKDGKLRGPMHGVPVIIKDNIDTADQMQTTAGSIALEGNIASKDAFIAQKLREAGAVILGKANMSEWANFRSTRSSSGWSSRGGQTKNPYVLDRSPCGSSSGSAVAVAANLCAVAIGTETNGSIACPASMTAIVGIKPTVGMVSRSGIIPISKTQDTAGPFGRTVADAAILLGAVAGSDPNDPARHARKGAAPADFAKYLDRNALKGKRIGVDPKFMKDHESITALLKKALDQMRSLGATIVEIDYMKTQDTDGAESALLQYEFKDGVNKYLSQSNSKVKTLEGLITYNKDNEPKAMPDFKQELFEISQAKGDLESKEYQEALKKIVHVEALIVQLFEEHKLDALCGPATGAPWCIDPVNGDFWTGYGAYGPAAITGFPSITLPLGEVSGLPVGISFIGQAYDEPGIIGIAYSYEQVSKNRTAPKFLKTIEK